MSCDIMIDVNTWLLVCILTKCKDKEAKSIENVTMQMQESSWHILIECLQII